MRIRIREYGIFYLMGGLAALGLRYRYGHAGCEELLWLLAPAAAWVRRLGGIAFTYVRGVGYVNHSIRFIIAPSCSGVRFLIIALTMLLFAFVHRTGSRMKGVWWTVFSLAASYGYTILVNGVRIVLAVRIPAGLAASGISPGRLSPEQLHTVIGAAAYFTALLLLYRMADLLLDRLERMSRPVQADIPSGKRGWYLVPAFWYVFLVLGIPFLNRTLQKDPEGYLEYAALTGGICLIVLAAACLVDLVTGVVFFTRLEYNKNVIVRHIISNKSVKERIYGTIDPEQAAELEEFPLSQTADLKGGASGRQDLGPQGIRQTLL